MTTLFRVRCEWGPNGAKRLSKECDVTIIVDVLSFSTSVDIAVGRSIQVLPYGGPLEAAPEFAIEYDALLAQHRGTDCFLPFSCQFCQDALCRASRAPIA